MDSRQRFEDLKSAILERFDVRDWAVKNLDKVQVLPGGEVRALCLFHDETEPSLYINEDRRVFYCQGCGKKGNAIDLFMEVNGVCFRDALEQLAADLGIDAAKPEPIRSPHKEPAPGVADRPPISKRKVALWHQRLRDATDRVKWLVTNRGMRRKTLAEHKIGWDGQRYTLPIADAAGKIVNVRRYSPEPGARNKMLHYTLQENGTRHAYGRPPRLWGLDRLVNNADPDELVYITEGEWDRLVLCQQGLLAVTGTHGCKSFPTEWAEHFFGRDVVIVYDSDAQGRSAAKTVAGRVKKEAASVRVVTLPFDEPGQKDVTDWFVSGRSLEEFAALVDAAKAVAKPVEASEAVLDFAVGEVLIYDCVPKRFQIDITPKHRAQKRVDIDAETLRSIPRFEVHYANYFDRFPEGLPTVAAEWKAIVNEWLDRGRRVEMPDEASDAAAIRLAVLDQLHQVPASQDVAEFDRGRPVFLPQRRATVISGAHLYAAVQNAHGAINRQRFFTLLKQMGLESRLLRLDGEPRRTWEVPDSLLEDASSPSTGDQNLPLPPSELN